MRFINLRTRSEENSLSFPSVLCIGNFDGVHLGHRQLVDAVINKSNSLKKEYPDLVSGAWFFDSNFYKRTPEIFTIEEKLDIFASLGLDYAIIADFNEIKNTTPQDFVQQILQGDCKCVFAVCGENFRFGTKASGSANDLVELMNGNAEIVTLLTDCERVVSSTYIRELLANGDIEKANRLLSSKYSVLSRVVHGKALGRKLGIPTINQFSEEKELILKNGIYCTECLLDGESYYGVTNVGIRPTVESTNRKNIETHIIGYSGDCYEKLVKIEFASRLRDEMKFDSIEDLKAQIQKDIFDTKAFFKI